MKRLVLWAVVPLLGAVAMVGCQKDDIIQKPLIEEAKSTVQPNAVGQGIEQAELATLMAKYGGLASGYEALRNQLPEYCVWRLEDLPAGYDLRRHCPPPPLIADSIEWVAVVSDVDTIIEAPASAWGPQEVAMAQAMTAAYGSMPPTNGMVDNENHPPKKFPDPDDEGGWDDFPETPDPTPTEPPEPTGIGWHVIVNNWAKNGDIYVKRDASSSGSSSSSVSSFENVPNESSVNIAIPGHWKHAAILDLNLLGKYGNRYLLLSASNRTDTYKEDPKGVIGRVGYDQFDGYWSVADEIGVYRVTSASEKERREAVVYAMEFYKHPFNFFTSRESDRTFYCSKLVWRGWKSQGYDLEPTVNSVTGTRWLRYLEFWRWNYKRVLGVKVYYPEFKWVWIRDMWVTPTDITETNDTYQIRRFHK